MICRTSCVCGGILHAVWYLAKHWGLPADGYLRPAQPFHLVRATSAKFVPPSGNMKFGAHEWLNISTILLIILLVYFCIHGGTAVAQWLRYCATNRKVAGSIPDGIFGIFHWHNPSDRTMALGSTQPLTEMTIKRISCGKFDWCVRLTNLPPSCAVVMKSWNLNFLEFSGPLQACNSSSSSCSTCIPDGHLQRVTIPDAVLIKFDLLMMSTTFPETCRGL